MDYGYATTNYSATGGGGGGGFVPGGDNGETPSTKRSYGKDTLRPVTIKQLLGAGQTQADAEYFMIDGTEATQVTFVAQVRNLSKQTTNITYKVDDGTGLIEVKEWVDSEAAAARDGAEGGGRREQVREEEYVRVWGRLKAFNNKRHVGANFVRPIKDVNEIQYHLLEATAVHLHFVKGPLEELQSKGGAGATGMASMGAGGGQNAGGGAGMGKLPPSTSQAARKVYNCLLNSEQTNEGLHMQVIGGKMSMEMSEVMKGADELSELGMVYTTVDEHTWAILDV